MKLFCALLTCFVLLAGCRFGEPVSLFDDEQAVEHAVATLRQRIGQNALVLNVEITSNAVTIRAQNPSDRSRIDEWRLARASIAWFNWERISGPEPREFIRVYLVNPDLEANLFELDTVDFTAVTNLLHAAIERAALANKATVTRVEISRRVYVLPRPASGEVQWTLDVASERESAQVFANTQGTIVGMNLSGTTRAKTLDLFAKPDLAAEAARQFRVILGTDPMLVRVNVVSQAVGFETITPDPDSQVPDSGNLSAQRVYIWTINGLQRTSGKVSANIENSKPQTAVFGVDEIDWSVMPKILTAAKEQLAMPQGHISGIELSKPTNFAGPLAVLWKVEVTNANNETGYVLADAAGAMRRIVPPASQRKATDWYNPQTMAATIARLGTELGQDRQYAEITFLGDKVIITAQDHMEPDSFSQILLTDTSLQRVGAAAPGAAKSIPFRIGELHALDAQRLAELERKTLATLKFPPGSISSITIGRGSMDPSPNGNVTIEIRAEERPFGRTGRVNYELDGTVIRAYLP